MEYFFLKLLSYWAPILFIREFPSDFVFPSIPSNFVESTKEEKGKDILG